MTGDEPSVRALAELVARQAAALACWESAELHVVEIVLRERLGLLGIEPAPALGAALMMVAELLAERAPEWGGDARTSLTELAVLGLRLLGEDRDEDPA